MTLALALLTLKGAAILLATLLSALAVGAVVQTQQPLVPASSPDQDTIVGQAANIPFQYEVLTGATDPITGGAGPLGSSTPITGTSFLESAGVDACTLATPVAGAPSAGGNDGLEVTVIDNGGHAHTVTTAANKINGNKHVATFNGTLGSFITFIARNGVWIATASSGVALT